MRNAPRVTGLLTAVTLALSALTAGAAGADPVEPAPWTVQGSDGVTFFGQDFDSACYDGAAFTQGLAGLRDLAQLLRRHGKRVLFSVAPDKSSVETSKLDPATLPHGDCDTRGLAYQQAVLDTFADPDFISMRAALAALATTTDDLYWHTDTHWTTLSTTRYAQVVARHLDPRIARRQTYADSTRTIVPDVLFLHGEHDVTETAPARLTTTPVRVVDPPGQPGYHPSQVVAGDLSWTTHPAARAYPGQTLLVGDSFTYVGLESLRPLFHHGRFLWLDLNPPRAVARQLAVSDTVVLEVVQRYLAVSRMVRPAFRHLVGKALRRRP